MYDKLGIQAITGISFSPAPEAQHMPKWVGALINCPTHLVCCSSSSARYSRTFAATPWDSLSKHAGRSSSRPAEGRSVSRWTALAWTKLDTRHGRAAGTRLECGNCAGAGLQPLERPGALVGGRESYGSMFSRFGNLMYDAKDAWSRRGLGRFRWSESAQIPLIWYL